MAQARSSDSDNLGPSLKVKLFSGNTHILHKHDANTFIGFGSKDIQKRSNLQQGSKVKDNRKKIEQHEPSDEEGYQACGKFQPKFISGSLSYITLNHVD